MNVPTNTTQTLITFVNLVIPKIARVVFRQLNVQIVKKTSSFMLLIKNVIQIVHQNIMNLDPIQLRLLNKLVNLVKDLV